MTEIDQPYPAEPLYKVVNTLIDDADETGDQFQKLVHVKLARTHVARMIGAQEYVDVDYVLVSSARLRKEDEHGTFYYEESAITASDEDGDEHKAYLYFAPRALSLEECLFALGEI
jgi:hypothetical protein